MTEELCLCVNVNILAGFPKRRSQKNSTSSSLYALKYKIETVTLNLRKVFLQPVGFKCISYKSNKLEVSKQGGKVEGTGKERLKEENKGRTQGRKDGNNI